MKNQIYMNVYVTSYGNGHKTCRFVQSIDDGELEGKDISELDALRIIWELVLAGGRREVSVNMYDRDIVTVGAHIFLPN